MGPPWPFYTIERPPSLENSELALKEVKQREEHRLAKKRNWAKEDYHRKKARRLEIVDGAEFVDIDGPFAQDGLL